MAYTTSPNDVEHLQGLAGQQATAQATPAPVVANNTYASSPNDISYLTQLAGGIQPKEEQTQAAQTQGAPSPAQQPMYQKVLPDIATGLLNGGQDINNLLTNVFVNTPRQLMGLPRWQAPQYDWNQTLGAPKPSNSALQNLVNPDQLLQGAAAYAPFAAAAGAAPVSEALGAAASDYGMPLLAKASSYLERSPLLGGSLNQVAPGMAYGAGATPNNPLAGAITGGVTAGVAPLVAGGIGKGVGLTFNTENSINGLKNSVLDYLQNAFKRGSANSPEETAQNMAQNYTGLVNPEASPDIGTVTNNPALRGAYEGLKYVPGTGVAKNANLMQRGLLDNQIDSKQVELQDQLNDPVSQTVASQLEMLRTQQEPHIANINQAPDVLDSLIPENVDRSNLNQANTDAVQQAYKNNKATAKQKYDALGQYDDTRLDQYGGAEQYPQYGEAATQLLAQRNNLQNLFGSDSDLGNKLKGELDKASSFLSNNQTFGATLGDARTRTQQLGNLASQLYNNGNNNEARLIMGLKSGLEGDVKNVLTNNGQPQIGSLWDDATSYYRNNITNFWDNPVINKATQGTVSSGTRLAQALHLPDPRIGNILSQLPQDNKNIALAQLISKGKGTTSSGAFNLDADKIAGNYAGLDQNVKRAVSTYNPDADSFFENLRTDLLNNKRIEEGKGALSAQLEKLNKSNQDKISTLSEQLDNLHKQKFGVKKSGTPSGDFLSKILKTGAVGAGVGSMVLKPVTGGLSLPLAFALRHTAQTLRSPDLINAYVNGSRFPVNSPLSPSVMPPLLNPQVMNSGGNSNGS